MLCKLLISSMVQMIYLNITQPRTVISKLINQSCLLTYYNFPQCLTETINNQSLTGTFGPFSSFKRHFSFHDYVTTAHEREKWFKYFSTARCNLSANRVSLKLYSAVLERSGCEDSWREVEVTRTRTEKDIGHWPNIKERNLNLWY